jgi:hypothetical protein
MELDPADAMELAQLLQLIAGWLDADPRCLTPSLLHYIGHHGYGLPDLRIDLARFTFLLGEDDGEDLFGHHDP